MFAIKSLRGLMTLPMRSNLTQVPHACLSEQAYEKCINQVTLLGRVGTDPTVRGSDENPFITFSLATNSYIKNTDDIRQKTDWHKVTVFKPNLRDSLASYLRKGQRILLQGKLSYSQYQDSQGNQLQSTTIIADDVIFMTSNEKQERSETQNINKAI